MREFETKKPASTYLYSVAFSEMLPEGATIDDFDVSIAIYEASDLQDPDVATMLEGSASLNSGAVTVNEVEYPANTVLMQKIKGGIIGADYVLTFAPIFSDGEKPFFDVLLPVRAYEPR